MEPHCLDGPANERSDVSLLDGKGAWGKQWNGRAAAKLVAQSRYQISLMQLFFGQSLSTATEHASFSAATSTLR